MTALESLGWSAAWADAFAPHAAAGSVPGRVAVEHRGLYEVMTEHGDVSAVVSGRLRHEALGRADFPAVGDWVALRHDPGDALAVVHTVVPRVNRFARAQAGRVHDEQIIAANLDTLFLATSLNRDLNPRRLERYLAAAAVPGLTPVVLLTKSDLCEQPEELVEPLRATLPGVALVAVSAYTGAGLDELAPYLARGRTAALVGMSGVGKSTLINRLLGAERFATNDIRAADDRGRHTTTHRELVRLPGGGLLIDNPGMRELRLWDDTADAAAPFADLAELAGRCRFTDCRHEAEPGCAVRQALADGDVTAERFASYEKLRREEAYQQTREDPAAARARKEEWKAIHRTMKKWMRGRDRK